MTSKPNITANTILVYEAARTSGDWMTVKELGVATRINAVRGEARKLAAVGVFEAPRTRPEKYKIVGNPSPKAAAFVAEIKAAKRAFAGDLSQERDRRTRPARRSRSYKPTERSPRGDVPGTAQPLHLPASDDVTFVFAPKGVRARARRSNEGRFVVEQGSQASADDTGSFTAAHSRKRDELLQSGALTRDSKKGHYVFTIPTAFSSASLAATIIAARNSNGNTCWRAEGTGQPLGKWLANRHTVH